MEHWNFIETNQSGQPILREGEKDILIDHNVGLYHGKSRILNRQNGRVFLTSQRIIYVDNANPTKFSIFLELDDIKCIEYQPKFLKRSPRLIAFLKDADVLYHASTLKQQEHESEVKLTSTWECPICSFSNITDGKFDESLVETPTCVNCGVPADFNLTKDLINITRIEPKKNNKTELERISKQEENICPVCTFINHLQIRNCEMCGTRLPKAKKIRNGSSSKIKVFQLLLENGTSHIDMKDVNFIQISFRKSDGLLFAEATEMTLGELSQKDDVLNKDLVSVNGVAVKKSTIQDLPYIETKLSRIGIASLEKSRETQLMQNDILFNNALSDLSSLMSLANDIENLYSQYRRIEKNPIKDKNNKKGPSLIVDRDKFYNKKVFIDEITRELFEFATLEFKDKEQREGCVMVSLVDFYAMYNKSMRIGVGFISPQELREACENFERLGLRGLKLTKINKRIMCLASDNALEIIKTKILQIVGRSPGCHLLQITGALNEHSQSNWTIGVITEILQNCVDSGSLVIDEQLSGVFYFVNSFWRI